MIFFENFKALYLLKSCQFSSAEFRGFGKRYENVLRVIFDQWPKLHLGFDVEPEIRILKVMYSICTGIKPFRFKMHQVILFTSKVWCTV